MSKFTEAILSAFGMAAEKAETPEDVKALVTATATALDAQPVVKAAEVQDPAPATVADQMASLGEKLDRVLDALSASKQEEKAEEKKPGGEEKLDELLDKLGGKEGGDAVTVPADKAADVCLSPGAKDAAVAILRSMRPVVAAIEDKDVQARVTDALISSIQDQGKLDEIAAAAQSSAQKAADQAAKTSYEQRCADSEAAYAARNPHKRQSKEV